MDPPTACVCVFGVFVYVYVCVCARSCVSGNFCALFPNLVVPRILRGIPIFTRLLLLTWFLKWFRLEMKISLWNVRDFEDSEKKTFWNKFPTWPKRMTQYFKVFQRKYLRFFSKNNCRFPLKGLFLWGILAHETFRFSVGWGFWVKKSPSVENIYFIFGIIS